MLDQGGGHVVSVSTSLVDHARSAAPAALASLTKGGLDAVTRSLAIEYATRGIRVNAVSLGVIKTPMHDPASYDREAAVHPLGRMGEISDVVDGILYLEQASFVTGETLHIDGGQAAGIEVGSQHNSQRRPVKRQREENAGERSVQVRIAHRAPGSASAAFCHTRRAGRPNAARSRYANRPSVLGSGDSPASRAADQLQRRLDPDENLRGGLPHLEHPEAVRPSIASGRRWRQPSSGPPSSSQSSTAATMTGAPDALPRALPATTPSPRDPEEPQMPCSSIRGS